MAQLTLLADRWGRLMTRVRLAEGWRNADGQAIASAAAVLVLGAVIIRLVGGPTGSGPPITALFVITVVIYALVSGRLSEFSAPGGWKAKFSEAANRPVTPKAEMISAASLELHEFQKEPAAEVKTKVESEAGDDKPIVLTMTLGNSTYNPENLRQILEYLETRRNFQALVIVDIRRKLIAYTPRRQASLLVVKSRINYLAEFVQAVSQKTISASWDPEFMTDAYVMLEDSYADALAAMNERSLSCVAVVDRTKKFIGIVNRDHITSSLLLALARSAQNSVMYTSGSQTRN